MRIFKKTFHPHEVFLSRWHPYFWIALAAFIVYCRVLTFDFSNLDDNILITRNYSFIGDISNIGRAFAQKVFTGSILPYYRPMLTVSLMIDALAGGLNPFVYHLQNLILHIIASCLVYPALTRMGIRREVSACLALVFAVHPALAPAVAWIPGRNDSLAAIFVLASFIFLADFLGKKGWMRYALHLLFLLAALFTKESAVMFMVLAAIYAVMIMKERMLSWRVAALWAGYLAAGGVWFFMRRAAIAGSFEMTIYDALKFFIMYLPAVVQMAGKAVFPFNLAVFPIVQDTPLGFGVAAILVMTAALLFSRSKRAPFVVFGVLWFLAFLIPSLLRPHAGAINDVLEHRLYLPIIGLFMVLAEIDFIKNAAKLAAVVCLAVVVLFGMLSAQRSGDFRDKFSFWENAVRSSPHSPYAHLLLGIVYFESEEEEYGKAVEEFKKAIALDNQLMRAHYYLGLAYQKDGIFKEAAREFQKEIALHPEFDPSYSSLAVAYYKLGKRDDLDILWKKALELNPDNLEASRNLAIYYFNKGDLNSAASYVRHLEDRGVQVPQDFLDALSSARKNDLSLRGAEGDEAI